MKLKYAAILLLLVFVGSCRKDLVNPKPDGTPEFSVIATLDGVPVEMEGGVDDYFLYTYADTSLGNVWEANGSLKKMDCTNCASFFTLSFRNEHAGYGQGMQPSFLPTGDISLTDWSEYFAGEKSVIRFIPDSNDQNGPVVSHYWNFGDGSSSNHPSPTHTFSLGTSSSLFQVMHITTVGASCTAAQSNNIDAKSDCVVDFETYTVGQQVYFTAKTSTPGSYTYQWIFGDSQTDYTANPSHVYSTPGEYNVSLTVENTSIGCSSTISKKVMVGQSGCHANYSYVIDEIITPVVDIEQFQSVEIEYVNGMGRVYRSSLIPQSAQSCRLLKVEPYKPNHEGKPTLKVTLEADCLLVNENYTDTIHLQNAVFNFAIGLP